MKYLSITLSSVKSLNETDHEYNRRQTAIMHLKRVMKNKGVMPSLLPLLLAACGGGGGGSSSPSPSTPSTPTPDFTESPANTFTARDDNNRTLSEGSSSTVLTVTGKGGNDSITTGSGADIIDGGAGGDTITSGSGADIILGGAGADTINAGGGDDIIVLIGTTSAAQYSDSAITSPAGVGADLSALLALSDINGHGTSDVVVGETIDGGAGNNTLVIYGDVDISGISITNLTTLWVNSTLSLTATQLSSMMTVTGDGSSVLNIVGNASAGIFDQVDLSAISMAGIGSITSDGNVELLVSADSQLSGISEIITTGTLKISIGGGDVSVNASELVVTLSNVDYIEIAAGATLVLDTIEAVIAIGEISLGGRGTISVSESILVGTDNLSQFDIGSDIQIEEVMTIHQIGSESSGFLQSETDIDWFSVSLEADTLYRFELTLEDPDSVQHFSYKFWPSSSTEFENISGEVYEKKLEDGGTYLYIKVLEPTDVFLYVQGISNVDGGYSFSSQVISTTEPDGSEDLPATNATEAIVTPSISYEGSVYAFFDSDTIAFEAVAGETYQFDLTGAGSETGTLDTYLINVISNSEGQEEGPSYPGAALANGEYRTFFTAPSTGTFYISVGSNNNSDGTYQLSMEQIVDEEPAGGKDYANDITTTGILEIGGTVTAEIGYESNGDGDWFAVILEAGKTYHFEREDADGGVGKQRDNSISYNGLSLRDSEGTYVANPFSSGDIYYSPEVSGVYYFTLEGSLGTYTLSASEIDTMEPGGKPDATDDINTTAIAEIGTTYTGSFGIPVDVDYIAVTLEAGQIYKINSASLNSDLNFTLQAIVSETNGEIDFRKTFNENASEAFFRVDVSGVYYLIISESDSDVEFPSSYTIDINIASSNEPDGRVDASNTQEDAETLILNADTIGNIAYYDDVDWFTLNIVEGEYYTLSISNIESLTNGFRDVSFYSDFAIYDFLATGSDSTIFGYHYTFQATATGSISLEVDEGYDPDNHYTLTATTVDMSEPDGGFDYDAGADTRAVTQVANSFNGTFNHQEDSDWISITLHAGESYTITHEGEVYSTGINTNNGGTIPHYFYPSEEEGAQSIIYSPEQSGEYYIHVNSDNSAGDYTVTVDYFGIAEPDGSADIFAWTDTTATLSMGSTVVGGVGLAGDRDWYAVTLEAGHIYFFTMKGEASGVGTLIDPRIAGLYNSEGIAIAGAFNDDGFGSSRESAMLFTVTESGTYYIAADGWNAETGTYEIAVSDLTDLLTGSLPYGPTNSETFTEYDLTHLSFDFRIDSLLGDSLYTPDPSGITTTVTYSFPSSNEFYSEREWFGYGEREGLGEPWTDFQALTMNQQESYRDLIEYVDTFINVSFVEVMDVEYSAGTIRVAWSGIDVDEGLLAWGYYPGNTGPISGDIWLFSDNLQQAQSADPGTYLYTILLHETGHTLGLKHPFEGGTTLPSYYDGYDYTVMAYNITTDYSTAYSADLYPQTYMYFDILALQHLYGATNVNEGDDIYTFDGNERYYLTMWDNGGNDTIEVINQSRGVTINLNGGWLDVGTTITYQTDHGPQTKSDTVYLPEEISIENAFGADHDDSIIGSSLANNLGGLNGNDTLDGREGADTLTGGAGADIFVTRSGDGGLAIADADIVLDFTDGEDLIGLNGILFDDLTIEYGTGDNAGDTIISVTSSGEYLMVLDGIDVSLITSDDFTIIQDEWWLA